MPHLLAALAVWDFSERSCAYLFGASTGDEYADKIDELLVDAHPGYVTRREIRDHFQRHAPAGKVEAALALLQRLGRAEAKKLEPEGGRAAEAWSAKVSATFDRSDISDQSALRRARALVR